MGEHPPSMAEQVALVLRLAILVVQVAIIADALTDGRLHRELTSQARASYRWAAEPMQREADVRREAAWVVWEAMQLLEEAAP